MKKEKLRMQVNDKEIQLEGQYVGNFFCVDRNSIDNHPSLTGREKDSIKEELRSNKNISLSE